ncbi:MAG: hypothetical protein OEW67_10740 [Cyclobacteriaceae bacterium]|nr:hypothetical protein [Cyclobacteriaceae bacterium]
MLDDCINAWKSYIGLTWIISVAHPLFHFLRLSNKTNVAKNKIWVFNFLEYIFLQGTLTVFWTSAETFCNVNDGQNGLEFVFTAWLSLPILIVLSFMFDLKLKRTKLNI